jgi:hypothetical protein
MQSRAAQRKRSCVFFRVFKTKFSIVVLVFSFMFESTRECCVILKKYETHENHACYTLIHFL